MVNVCFCILTELLAKKKVTAKYLAEKYEISVRTVYRYLDVLAAGGVNFFTDRGRNGGIKIADDYKLSASYLTDAEKKSLIEAVSIWSQTTSGTDAENLKTKLAALGGGGAQPVRMAGDKIILEGGLDGDSERIKNKIAPLKKAIDENFVVRIEYRSRSGSQTERDIEPRAFVFKQMVWYVYAYCRNRKDFRTFKLSRIIKLKVTDEKFIPASDEKYEWSLTDNASYEKKDILVRLKESVRYDAEEWLGVENVKPLSEPDGEWKYIASAVVTADASLVPKLLSFGDGIKILLPYDLKAEALKAAQNLLKNNE